MILTVLPCVAVFFVLDCRQLHALSTSAGIQRNTRLDASSSIVSICILFPLSWYVNAWERTWEASREVQSSANGIAYLPCHAFCLLPAPSEFSARLLSWCAAPCPSDRAPCYCAHSCSCWCCPRADAPLARTTRLRESACCFPTACAYNLPWLQFMCLAMVPKWTPRWRLPR
jgi:hypothetical protein